MRLQHFRLAVAFLTLLPLAPRKEASPEDWKAVIKYFPWVAYIFAFFNAALLVLFRLLPGLGSKNYLLALGLILISLLLSGGLHLDGLADSIGGIAASKNSHAETRTVMRDSRVGAFGAIAISLLLISKALCLSQLDLLSNFNWLLGALVMIPILERSSVVIVMAKQAKDHSEHISKVSELMGDFDKNEALRSCALALGLGLLISSLLASGFSLMTFIDSFISLLAFSVLLLGLSYGVSLYLAHKLYGHSGDSLGAGMEITEALGFMLLALS